jgi:hypothetical protein
LKRNNVRVERVAGEKYRKEAKLATHVRFVAMHTLTLHNFFIRNRSNVNRTAIEVFSFKLVIFFIKEIQNSISDNVITSVRD